MFSQPSNNVVMQTIITADVLERCRNVPKITFPQCSNNIVMQTIITANVFF